MLTIDDRPILLSMLPGRLFANLDLSIVVEQATFTFIPFQCLEFQTFLLIYHLKGKYQHLQFHLHDIGSFSCFSEKIFSKA